MKNWRARWDADKYVFNESLRERKPNLIDAICSDGYTPERVKVPDGYTLAGEKPSVDARELWNIVRESFNRSFNRSTAPPPKPAVINTRTDLRWYGVDFDGTIAKSLWQPGDDISITGDPIWENVTKLRQVHEAGYKIVIHTARPWSEYENLENWLTHYDIPFKEIQCGKPLYRYYVDDRAIPADADTWLPEVES